MRAAADYGLRAAHALPLALAALIGCGRGERAPREETAAAAVADTAPADTVRARPGDSGAPVAAGARASAPSSARPDGRITTEELRRYLLTLDNVREMHRASLEWARAAPNRRPPIEDDGDRSVTGVANRLLREFQAHPALARAINASEMPTRRAAMHFAVLGAAVGAARGGPLPPEVAPENVTFVRGHAAELERMRNQREALMRTTMP